MNLPSMSHLVSVFAVPSQASFTSLESAKTLHSSFLDAQTCNVPADGAGGHVAVRNSGRKCSMHGLLYISILLPGKFKRGVLRVPVCVLRQFSTFRNSSSALQPKLNVQFNKMVLNSV